MLNKDLQPICFCCNCLVLFGFLYLSLFVHVPDEEIPIQLIQLMIDYFESYDMFENCADLMIYIGINYNDDGTRITNDCECPQPIIKEYSRKMNCGHCEKRLRR